MSWTVVDKLDGCYKYGKFKNEEEAREFKEKLVEEIKLNVDPKHQQLDKIEVIYELELDDIQDWIPEAETWELQDAVRMIDAELYNRDEDAEED